MKSGKNSPNQNEISSNVMAILPDPENLCDLFATLFGCTPNQSEVFIAILNNGEICIEKLERILEKERSCVQKVLLQLINFGLIERRSVNFGEFNEICHQNPGLNGISENEEYKKARKQGYLYLYKVIDRIKLQAMMEEKFASLHQDMENLLKKYP